MRHAMAYKRHGMAFLLGSKKKRSLVIVSTNIVHARIVKLPWQI